MIRTSGTIPTERALREKYGLEHLGPAPDPASDAERVSLGTGRRDLRTRDHAAVVYWRREELLETVVPYLAAGLDAGDKVVYVADDVPPDAIRSALAAAGVRVDDAVTRGALAILTARDAFFGDGRFDVERALASVAVLAEQASRDGFPRVRFSVEMTYLLADVPGIERGPEFESRANDEVFAKYPFVCICSFNAARDTGDLVREVLATHPILISRGVPLANPHYRPWADRANRAAR